MLRRRPAALKLLVVSDVDGSVARVNQLCDAVVCSADCDVAAVLVCGGLVGGRAPHAYEALEALGRAEGDMTAVISRLEMIISRVVYIPDSNDPPTTRSVAVAPPALTQYSANVFSRAERLAPDVAVMGEEHYIKLVKSSRSPVEDAQLALVLRDSAESPRLPIHKADDTRVIELVGGRDQDPRIESARVFVGSLRHGQYAVLELEKQAVDDSWSVRSTAFRQLAPLDES